MTKRQDRPLFAVKTTPWIRFLGSILALMIFTRTLPAVPAGREPRSGNDTIARCGEWPPGMGSIRGHVFRRTSESRLGHAQIRLASQSGASWTVGVTFLGHFSFVNLPPGLYQLSATNTLGYQDAFYDPNQTGQARPFFQLNPSQRIFNVSLEMKPMRPYRSLSGRILDEGGKPVSGRPQLRVYAWVKIPHNPFKGHFQRLASATVRPGDGSFAVKNLDGRDVIVQVVDTQDHRRDSAFVPCFYPGATTRSPAVPFGDADRLTGMDIVLRQSEGTHLTGRITDGAGHGIPEAQISLFHADMFFDLFCAYTDANGFYQLNGVGSGNYLVHVDARHRGWVKTRRHITIDPSSELRSLDVTLTRGVTIRGRFIDEAGRPWTVGRSSGFVGALGAPGGGPASNFSFANRYAPDYQQKATTLWSEQGQGDHPFDYMAFPTPDTFEIPAAMPGALKFNVNPRGARLIEIRHGDHDITRDTIQTSPGQMVNDITIVVHQQQ